MKAKFHEIAFHYGLDREPKAIMSVDMTVDPEGFHRVATAGGDSTVKIWRLDVVDQSSTTKATPTTADGDDAAGNTGKGSGEGSAAAVTAAAQQVRGDSKFTFLAELTHQCPVNCVRFSPDGKTLAAGDDTGTIILWGKAEIQPTTMSAVASSFDEDYSVEKWRMHKIIKAHRDNVLDVVWSADSTYILSGSVDNTSAIWDAASGQCLQTLKDHNQYVQGVAWSPLNNAIATMSSDRTCKLYRRSTQKKATSSTSATSATSATPPVFVLEGSLSNVPVKRKAKEGSEKEKDSDAATKEDVDSILAATARLRTEHMFVDEMKTTYFRRLAYSPDGQMLLMPAGLYRDSGRHMFASYMFHAHFLSAPMLRLPSEFPTVAVRFCPILFERRNTSQKPIFSGIPYRMVYAIANKCAVLIYDTEQLAPLAVVSDTHRAALTDLAWSRDGLCLTVASEDGYCTTVSFDKDDLGQPYEMTAQQVAAQLQAKGEVYIEAPTFSAATTAVPQATTVATTSKASAEVTKPKATSTKPTTAKRKITPLKVVSSSTTPTTADATTASAQPSKSKTPKRRITPAPLQDKAAATPTDTTATESSKATKDTSAPQPRQQKQQEEENTRQKPKAEELQKVKKEEMRTKKTISNHGSSSKQGEEFNFVRLVVLQIIFEPCESHFSLTPFFPTPLHPTVSPFPLHSLMLGLLSILKPILCRSKIKAYPTTTCYTNCRFLCDPSKGKDKSTTNAKGANNNERGTE
eukprot:m.110860 g.110860  ORF g.110860 m.110860 type:complete len:746 (+) comp13410_c0_seq1:173-2410(+)